jgi:predicted lipoprotein with Yx(FWY)xxD motif
LLSVSLSATAFASPSIGIGAHPQAGNILVDDRGMTLYRYTPDRPDSSTCYDSCAKAWPPLLVDSIPAVQDATLAAGLGIAPRTDGTEQLTYKGSPLYYYVADTQPADANGQGDGGVWFVVNPS